MLFHEQRFPDATASGPLHESSVIPTVSSPTDEVARARTHLTSLTAFGRFDLSPDGRLLSGCMDPRADKIDGRQQTKIMGPGAGVGEAVDHSKALTIVEKQFVTPEDAHEDDLRHRRCTMVEGGHPGCLYVGSLVTLLTEEANPSDLTLDLVDSWLEHHELDIPDKAFKKLYGAAEQQLEYVDNKGGLHYLLDKIDQAFPDYHNVPKMVGEATPHFYIVNNYPHLGLNRHKKHAELKLQAQAYHDNVGARLSEVHNTPSLSKEVRLYRMGALLLRSAAAVTVITDLKRKAGNPLEYWEVEIGEHGPQFTRYNLH